jgi:crotonobetainyl-CoA:carnitine CoA-transferase CaiB-like acyl-CoA transferase
MLGEHSEQVLLEVLGYSREKVARLQDEGVINKAI